MQNDASRPSRPPGFFLWVFLLGGAGFLAGFIGPIVLNPDANQGPLVGIFLSGPGGAVLGLILFAICSTLRVSASRQWLVLGLFAVLGVGVTLAFCLPGPEFRGYVFEVQVDACKPPAELADGAVAYWQKRIAGVTWAQPRPGWEQDARSRLQRDPGVVLQVTVLRQLGVWASRKPWSRGSLSTRGWFPALDHKSFYATFAGDSCAAYPLRSKSVQFASYSPPNFTGNAADWPPREIPAFLDLLTLEPLPPEYQRMAGH
ncbi:MAG TPA: hypothetical protein VLW54_13130 [Candidatus Acidoferrales bacterium]|nr:hypothetical protein [Candidatus Acidoferrales bacterium]